MYAREVRHPRRLSAVPSSVDRVNEDPVAEKHHQTLRLFKRRAEDIFGCELAQREDALKLGQQFHMNFVVDKRTGASGIRDFRQVIAPKEQVAYALTLIRPLTLTKKGDRLAWVTVLTALEFFCPSERADIRQKLDELRGFWTSYPARRMRIMQGPSDPAVDGPRVDAWDNEIARKFLYGDLVHGDDNAELLDALGDDQVVFSASAMAADGFMLVNNTYQVLHWIRPDIAPNDAHFSRRLHEAGTESDTSA